jgi:hypothetical protein
MAMSLNVKLAAILICTMILAGCSEQPTEERPNYGLDSGFFYSRWTTMEPCPESRCLTDITVFYESRTGLAPRLAIGGSHENVCEITYDEWHDVFQAVDHAVYQIKDGRDSCREDRNSPEQLMTSSGDYGRSVGVAQDCESPAVVEARQALRSLAERYFPQP